MIHGYQRGVYGSLKKSAVAHHLSLAMELPCRPRFHRLVVGPTGTGKSFLAGKVAEELNWAVFHINVSGWVVMGAKERPTYHALVDWLMEVPRGRPVCIVLDELDKVDGEDSWTRFLRGELYSLLDGKFIFSDYCVAMDEDETPEDAAGRVNAAEARLRNAWFVGCGAFQHLQDEKPSMGFSGAAARPMDQARLSGSLQRELVNRFHQDVLCLPQLGRADYQAMAESVIGKLDPEAAALASSLAPSVVEQAVAGKTGARMAENLLCRVIEGLSDGVTLLPWAPEEKKTHPKRTLEDSMWDQVITGA